MQGQGRLNISWKFIAAVIIYITFAVYLFEPNLRGLSRWKYLWIANVCVASTGCYILSRRWVAEFAGSFFAGAIYGFGPYMLSLPNFHPTAGFLVASIPWLFCPAAYCFKGRRRWLSILFSTLPFIAIILFFQATTVLRLFVASTQSKLNLNELYSLFAPIVAAKRATIGTNLTGFYHVPLAGLIMGSAMLVSARRYGIMAIIFSSIILVFFDSINSRLEISPVIWLSITTLCFSIITGAGFQGLASAGFADRKWILASAITLGVLAIVTLLLAAKCFQVFLSLGDGYARLFVEAAKMYLLGAIVLAICFFMTCGKLRMHPLRETLISIAFALDIFIGAEFIIGKFF